mmetsp:Transcript_27274/g.69436  ORF Transcript_27274/g.69436 Transcript_27274/m.69436 type:complete len:252 (-) Transcript_27274:267-1022(-)
MTAPSMIDQSHPSPATDSAPISDGTLTDTASPPLRLQPCIQVVTFHTACPHSARTTVATNSLSQLSLVPHSSGAATLRYTKMAPSGRVRATRSSPSRNVMSALTAVLPRPRTASTTSLTGTTTESSRKGSRLERATRVFSTVSTRQVGGVEQRTVLVVTTQPLAPGNTSRSTSLTHSPVLKSNVWNACPTVAPGMASVNLKMALASSSDPTNPSWKAQKKGEDLNASTDVYTSCHLPCRASCTSSCSLIGA